MIRIGAIHFHWRLQKFGNLYHYGVLCLCMCEVVARWLVNSSRRQCWYGGVGMLWEGWMDFWAPHKSLSPTQLVRLAEFTLMCWCCYAPFFRKRESAKYSEEKSAQRITCPSLSQSSDSGASTSTIVFFRSLHLSIESHTHTYTQPSLSFSASICTVLTLNTIIIVPSKPKTFTLTHTRSEFWM